MNLRRCARRTSCQIKKYDFHFLLFHRRQRPVDGWHSSGRGGHFFRLSVAKEQLAVFEHHEDPGAAGAGVLFAVGRGAGARRRAENHADPAKAAHDDAAVHQYLTASQDEIVNFSVEHFKSRFWLTSAENTQLDVLFNKLREEWKAVRNDVENPEDHLDELRREILKFDVVCGLKKYNGGQWSHVALHE